MVTFKNGDHLSVAIGAPNYGKEGLPQIGRVYIIPTSKLRSAPVEECLFDTLAEQILEGQSRMGKFGWSMVSVLYNQDVFEDLVVSAPVMGTKFLLFRIVISISSG